MCHAAAERREPRREVRRRPAQHRARGRDGVAQRDDAFARLKGGLTAARARCLGGRPRAGAADARANAVRLETGGDQRRGQRLGVWLHAQPARLPTPACARDVRHGHDANAHPKRDLCSRPRPITFCEVISALRRASHVVMGNRCGARPLPPEPYVPPASLPSRPFLRSLDLVHRASWVGVQLSAAHFAPYPEPQTCCEAPFSLQSASVQRAPPTSPSTAQARQTLSTALAASRAAAPRRGWYARPPPAACPRACPRAAPPRRDIDLTRCRCRCCCCCCCPRPRPRYHPRPAIARRLR